MKTLLALLLVPEIALAGLSTGGGGGGPGGGDALTTNTLAQFAPTTSSQLAGVITNETGTGSLVFGTGPRISPRVTTITSNATWSPSADTDDIYEITAQAAAATVISNPSGTPVNGQKLMIKVTGTAARALTWSGSQWRASSDLALPTTTTTTKTMYLGFIYSTAGTGTWDLVAKLDNF